MKSSFAAALIAGCLLAGSLASASTGQLQGTVIDAVGAIYAKVRVIVIDLRTLNVTTLVTGNDGNFGPLQLEPGAYEVKAGGVPCTIPASRRISVKAERNTEVKLKLEMKIGDGCSTTD